MLAVGLGGCFSDPPPELPAPEETTTGGEATEGELGDTSARGSSSSGGGSDETSSGGWWGSSSGSTSEAAHETGSSSGGEEPGACGNGEVEAGEVCDEPDAPLQPGACRPDCSGPIPTRTIRLSSQGTQGDLGPDPVATMDGLCPPDHRALFAFGEQRRATAAPNQSVDAIDWVLQPYTAYANLGGEVIWVTDAVPLLGVRAGVQQELLAPVVPFRDNPPGALTGMRDDWTTLQAPTCAGWSSVSASERHNAGIPWVQHSGGYLNNGGEAPCDVYEHAYCVQQP